MRTAIVTGASRGLGLEITRQLLAANWQVVAVSREESESLHELRSSVLENEQLADDSHGRTIESRLQFVECDLVEPGTIKPALDQAMPSDIEINALVNNAGMAYDDLATNMHFDSLESMFRVNVFSGMELSKWAIRRMLLHRTRGSLLHISSISVHTGYKGLSMYAATKGAMEAYSKNLAREWGSLGIRSNCIVAGFMETQMSATLSDEQRDRIYNRTCLKQPTAPESAASMVAYLVSEQARSVTGQNFFVDSGTI